MSSPFSLSLSLPFPVHVQPDIHSSSFYNVLFDIVFFLIPLPPLPLPPPLLPSLLVHLFLPILPCLKGTQTWVQTRQ